MNISTLIRSPAIDLDSLRLRRPGNLWLPGGLILLSLIVAMLAGMPGAWAQGGGQRYPTRPIHVVVPFVAGGPSDIIARLLSQRIGERLGQPVVVENRPGASANLGTEQVAKAPGDGYTLLLGSTYIVVNPSLFKDLRYDVLRDLTPVALADLKPMVLIASPQFAPSTLQEVIAAARAQPGKINFASPGSGTLPHLAGELLNTAAGIRLVHVPYKGITPAQTDIMGGQVQLMFDAVASAMPSIRSGKLKAIAVPNRTRHPLLPGVPSAVEAGLPELDLIAWDGFFAPSSTPLATVERLYDVINAVINSPETREKMSSLGAMIPQDTRAQFVARVRDEIRKWAEVVRASGARAD